MEDCFWCFKGGDEAKFKYFRISNFLFNHRRNCKAAHTHKCHERKQFNWKFPNKSINFPLQFNFLFASWKKSFSISVFSKSTTEMKWKKKCSTPIIFNWTLLFSDFSGYSMVFFCFHWIFQLSGVGDGGKNWMGTTERQILGDFSTF